MCVAIVRLLKPFACMQLHQSPVISFPCHVQPTVFGHVCGICGVCTLFAASSSPAVDSPLMHTGRSESSRLRWSAQHREPWPSSTPQHLPHSPQNPSPHPRVQPNKTAQQRPLHARRHPAALPQNTSPRHLRNPNNALLWQTSLLA